MGRYRQQRFSANRFDRWIGCRVFLFFVCLTSAFHYIPGVEGAPWSFFEAIALTGEKVDSDRLVGQPTLLIVTPSRDAAGATRKWVKALRNKIDPDQYFVRDVLAVDLPFFMSEEDAIKHAKEVVPERYHDQTWILNAPVIEQALGVPRDSDEACIVVLDREGGMVAQVHGPLTEHRLNTIVEALKSLK